MFCSLSGLSFFFFQAEDGIRDLVRSRGLGDVYKRQGDLVGYNIWPNEVINEIRRRGIPTIAGNYDQGIGCLLYTSDAADERSSVDLGGRRII